MPGEGRERCLSLPLLQTLSHRPGAGGCWSPCGDPVPGLPLRLSCVAGEVPKMDQ